MLIGRATECRSLDAVLSAARAGRSGALVLRGEPGIGKSSMLEYAASQASDFSVLRARAFEAERELPYAGLSMLLRPVLERIEGIPAAQRRALATALGIAQAAPIDRFAAYAATLSLLAAAAEDGPLLAIVDDAHWLDESSAEALAFAGRRLDGEGIALMLAARADESSRFEGSGLSEMALRGLDVASTAALLRKSTGRKLPLAVSERLHAATAGNPLALLELAAAMTPEQLADAAPSDRPAVIGAGILVSFGRVIARMPVDTQRALVVVAADDSATVEALAGALYELSLTIDALAPAEDAGLLAIADGAVEFRHPLVRAAAYQRAQASERRAAHHALAAALDGHRERGRRAWHLAAATLGPDEAVAVELEAAAAEARGRGAPVAAARALEAAAQLTPAGTGQFERLLGAACDHQLAGALDRAAGALDRALALAAGDPLLRAEVQHARARGEMMRGSPLANQSLLLDEAERVRPFDASKATAMEVDAIVLSPIAGRPAEMLRLVEQVAPRAEALGGPTAVMLVWATSAAQALVGDPARARQLLASVEPHVMAQPFAFSFMAPLLACQYVWLEEFEHARAVASALVDQAQQQGVVIGLGLSLACLADIDLRRGDVSSAHAFASRSVDLAEEIGLQADLSHSLARLAHVEAVSGRVKECRRHSLRASTIASELEIVSVSVISDAVLGLLELGLGRLEAAVQWLEPAGRRALSLGLEEPSVVPWAQDLAEAYVRLGAREQAEATLESLERRARRTGGRLPRAAVLRCRGLAGEDGEFEQHFTEALALHDERPAPFERARTELCFGERLRRARRRTEARGPLRRALETFERLGAEPWADRALRELHATGERARRRVPQTTNELTPQELQVAVLMAEGATIKDAAAELFLSPKTIETHLYHAYAKLGVRSRVALARCLATPVKPRPRKSTSAGRP